MIARTLPATAADMVAVANALRPSDIREGQLLGRALGRKINPIESFQMAARMAAVWCMWVGHARMGLAGITPLGNELGAIWFMGTEAADRNPVALTRQCRRFIAAHRPDYCWLGNIVPTEMQHRVAWLQHLGFTVGQTTIYGAPEGFETFGLLRGPKG